jgi:nucleoid DNA-binding protein
VPKGQLGLIRQRIARLQPALGRLFTRKDADGKIRGGVWRTPKRRPASHGRDMLAVQLQKRGLTFDEAHAAVTAIWDAIKEGLKRGESVETPLGLFKIVRRTKPYPRWRLKRWQRMHKNPKRVVFIASPGLLGGR